MAYVKIIYQNSPSTATPINAQNLNHMDDGIAENDRRLNELETAGVVNKFNGRSGNITPEKGDYDIADIGATDGQDGYVPVWRNSGTEQEPNWGFEMEAQGGAGHVLVDSDGNDMPSEDKMQFADAFLSDDDVNGKTVVENIKEHSTKADYDNATEDGFHVIDDGEDAVIHPSSEDYVEVVADGDKTYADLLDELANQIDFTKVGVYSCLVYAGVDVYLCVDFNSNNGEISFSRSTAYNLSHYFTIARPIVSTNGSTWYEYRGNAIYNNGVNKPSNGRKLTLYYGNKKAVVDLQTTANRCLMGDGRTVQQALSPSGYITDGLSYTNCTYISGGYIKIGNLVQLSIKVTITTASTSVTDYITLPSSISPSVPVSLISQNTNDDLPPINCSVSSGKIYMKNTTANKMFTISGCWVV